MTAVLGWLVLAAGVLIAVPAVMAAAASAGRHDKPGAIAAGVAFFAGACMAFAGLPMIGIIPDLAGLVLATALAFGGLAVLSRDKQREPWDAVMAAAAVVRNTWRPAPPVPADLPPDELAERREAKAVPLRQAVPDPPPDPNPLPPSPARERPHMTTPPPPPDGTSQGAPAGAPAGGMPAGSAADIFTAVQQIILRAQAEGMPGKHRAIKMFAEMHDYLSRAESEFARRMSEPDQGYPPQVWEPLAKMAGHSRAASLAAGESDQALAALARMPVGDLAVSPVRSPHSNELNAFS